jgi:hypothetical protein
MILVEAHAASIAGKSSWGAGPASVPPSRVGSSVTISWRPLTSILCGARHRTVVLWLSLSCVHPRWSWLGAIRRTQQLCRRNRKGMAERRRRGVGKGVRRRRENGQEQGSSVAGASCGEEALICTPWDCSSAASGLSFENVGTSVANRVGVVAEIRRGIAHRGLEGSSDRVALGRDRGDLPRLHGTQLIVCHRGHHTV